ATSIQEEDVVDGDMNPLLNASNLRPNRIPHLDSSSDDLHAGPQSDLQEDLRQEREGLNRKGREASCVADSRECLPVDLPSFANPNQGDEVGSRVMLQFGHVVMPRGDGTGHHVNVWLDTASIRPRGDATWRPVS